MLGDRFELVKELGRGGMAVVWRARDRSSGDEVALKILPREVARDAAAVKRLEREAGRLADLDHPAVARVIGCGTHMAEPVGPLAWLAMELFEGPSLRELLAEEGPMPLERVVAFLRPVAEALDHAHRQRVVHMDVKPGNILFTAHPDEGGRPKLIDFGIAHELHETLSLTREELEERLEDEPPLTGTPAYMSPEQFGGEPPRATTDVWALTVVAYQLLGDQLPFVGSPSIRRKQVLTMDPPPVVLGADPAPLAEQVDGVLRRGLARDRKQRLATARALVDGLEAVLRPLPTLHHQLAPRPWVDRQGAACLAAATLLVGTSMLLDPFGGERWYPSGAEEPPMIGILEKVPDRVRGNREVWRASFHEGWKALEAGEPGQAVRLFELARGEGSRLEDPMFREYVEYLARRSLALALQEDGDHEAAREAQAQALAMK